MSWSAAAGGWRSGRAAAGGRDSASGSAAIDDTVFASIAPGACS